MAVLDIRAEGESQIDEIIIADIDSNSATHLLKGGLVSYGQGEVMIGNKQEDYFLSINSKEHAQHIIAALNKAIEFGWFN